MLLLVGLGNPGSEYAKNRHNIGFMAIDAIAERHSFAPFRKKFHGLLSEGVIDGAKVLALKPETFMNESGRAVAGACAFYKIRPEDIIVVHDEIDLVAAKVRVKRGGGHAGHNGLRSIHDHIGPDYGRVRLGIGHPGDKDQVSGHVLKDFSKADGEWLDKVITAIAAHVGLLVAGRDSDFMGQVAQDISPPRANKPKPDPKPDTENKTDTKNGF
ncbi:MAG: aminoacyl-tRNA hydrolase [Rhodospirillales bacterium]|nr:aminoacyl-tRNA hydrolase [Rhodospirillales bacterium]